MIFNSVLEMIGKTPILKLNSITDENMADIYVKLEKFNAGGSVKDRAALGMIEKAEKNGLLKPGSTIVEPTSGNTGIALAMIGKLKGYKVIIVPMPFNLAVLDWDEAMEVVKHHPEIKKWVIGGHSLGGVMASNFLYNKKPSNIKGLVFYASYPHKVDFSKSDLKVLSIYGSKDSILDKSKLKNTKKLLPYETIYVEIQGGNHSQFGNYGFQKGDSKAEISRDKQQKISIEYTTKLLESIK